MGRGKKKLTAEQNAKLTAVYNKHAERMARKGLVEQTIREQVYKSLLADELEESRLANAAIHAKVTKTAVSRAVGLGNWYSFKELLDLTADEFIMREEKPLYTFDPATRMVTINWWEHKDGVHFDFDEPLVLHYSDSSPAVWWEPKQPNVMLAAMRNEQDIQDGVDFFFSQWDDWDRQIAQLDRDAQFAQTYRTDTGQVVEDWEDV